MLLLILSPIAIVALVLVALQAISTWRQSEHELQDLVHSAEQEVAERQRIGSNDDNSNKNKNSNIRSPNKVGADAEISKSSTVQPDTLILTTKHGKIRITLRPDLSAGSVDYVHQLVETGVCRRCNLYRAEKPGILQGVMANKDVAVNKERGECPPGAETVKNDCPAWDKQCGCHGPVMTKGAVAWAAGQAGGPDFFIDNYPQPAKWWGTQHTNFGRIEDEASFQVIDTIFNLPLHKQGMMTMLQDPIPFDMSLEKDGEVIASIIK